MEADRLYHRIAYSNMPEDKKEVIIPFQYWAKNQHQCDFQALRQARKLRNASRSEEEKEVGWLHFLTAFCRVMIMLTPTRNGDARTAFATNRNIAYCLLNSSRYLTHFAWNWSWKHSKSPSSQKLKIKKRQLRHKREQEAIFGKPSYPG